MAEYYTKAQVNEQATLIGNRIKTVKESIPSTVQVQGQSTESVVSQKLFTDTIGDIAATLDAINGVI